MGASLTLLALIGGTFYLAPKIIKFLLGFAITLIIIRFFKTFLKVAVGLIILAILFKYTS
jgi:hypothetical protein